MSFSVISQMFFWWVSKISFLTTWPKKRALQKHFQNMGFQFFWRKYMHHETAIFGQTQIHKFQLSFFCLFLLFKQQKHKKCWSPYFYSG